MNVWQLAWTEWYRSAVLGGKPNCDFLWLTGLLSLTLILALLLYGGREGLLNKFVDVSVGYLEGAGIPIWLTAESATGGIDREVLQQVSSQLNLKLYPYREVECHEVNLPNQKCGDTNKIWDETAVLFDGWAVTFDDPLWKMGLKTQPTSNVNSNDTSGLPLDIILNRSLFEQYFSCAVYIEELQTKPLPFKIPTTATTQSDKLSCLADGTLWLDVKGNQELLPFRIHWQSHIPTMQKLAFLFPLNTLNTLKMAKQTGIRYEPRLAQANQTTARVKELMIWQNGISDDTMATLLSCLQNPKKNANRFSMKRPLPKSWVIECAKQNGIPVLKKGQRLSPPFIQITAALPQKYDFQYHDDDYLTLSCQGNSTCQPCQALSGLTQRIPNSVACSQAGTQAAKIDMIAANSHYYRAFAYVTDRAELLDQVKKLKKNKAFDIHPTYNDALVRFQFIDEIMGILEWVFVILFFIFLGLLLWVQVSIVINHRQHNYGILLAKGMSWEQVRRIVCLQMFISFVVAMFFAGLIAEGMQYLLDWRVESVATAERYIDHIVATQLDLLPLSFLWDYLLVGGIVLIVLGIITEVLLRRMILKRYLEPAYLF
jgi:hypothetical protein